MVRIRPRRLSIGLACHYFVAYGGFAEDWVERETQRILEEGKK